MMGLERELKDAAASLQRCNPTAISLKAGCELFLRWAAPRRPGRPRGLTWRPAACRLRGAGCLAAAGASTCRRMLPPTGRHSAMQGDTCRYTTRTSALELDTFSAAKKRLIERGQHFAGGWVGWWAHSTAWMRLGGLSELGWCTHEPAPARLQTRVAGKLAKARRLEQRNSACKSKQSLQSACSAWGAKQSVQSACSAWGAAHAHGLRTLPRSAARLLSHAACARATAQRRRSGRGRRSRRRASVSSARGRRCWCMATREWPSPSFARQRQR